MVNIPAHSAPVESGGHQTANSLVRRAYRYELKPNATQRKLFAQYAGVARFAFNWGLARRIRYYRLFK